MSHKVRFTNEAIDDLEESAVWYNDRKENLGIEFIEEVEDKVNFIIQNPESFPFKYSDRRSVSLKRFPFHIVFIVENNEVIVLAVAHHKRNPFFWQQRNR
jgi:plasmid stabilization system protein ParE